MLVTKDHIDYNAAPYGFVAHIPAGVPVTPANNLPATTPAQYWVGSWPGMTEQVESWQRNYGFLVDASQVEERVIAKLHPYVEKTIRTMGSWR